MKLSSLSSRFPARAFARMALMAVVLTFSVLSARGQTYTFKQSFGSAGSGNGQFNTPSFITLDSTGTIVVDDFLNSRLQKFTHDGTFIQTIGVGQLSRPLGVITDSSNNIYASNYDASRVDLFTSTGTFIRTAAASVPLPYGLALGATGNLYVANNHTFVSVFDGSGSLVQTIGGAGQITDISGITLDGSGNLYVADYGNRVEEFDNSGAFVRTIGGSGSGDGQLTHPVDIRLDSSGNVYVSDFSNDRIVEFDSTGAYVQNIGVGILHTPYGLSFDSAGNLFTVDRGNNRVVEFDVTPSAETPEPSAFAIVGIGVALLALRLKKRK